MKNQIKSILVGVGATLFVMLMLFLIFSNSTTIEEKQNPVKKSEQKVVKEMIKQESEKQKINLEQTFVNGCVEAGGNNAYCSCVYNNLINKTGKEGFMDLVQKFTNGNITDEQANLMVESTNNCIHLIN